MRRGWTRSSFEVLSDSLLVWLSGRLVILLMNRYVHWGASGVCRNGVRPPRYLLFSAMTSGCSTAISAGYLHAGYMLNSQHLISGLALQDKAIHFDKPKPIRLHLSRTLELMTEVLYTLLCHEHGRQHSQPQTVLSWDTWHTGLLWSCLLLQLLYCRDSGEKATITVVFKGFWRGF